MWHLNADVLCTSPGIERLRASKVEMKLILGRPGSRYIIVNTVIEYYVLWLGNFM
jgi:hypothetical protein